MKCAHKRLISQTYCPKEDPPTLAQELGLVWMALISALIFIDSGALLF